MTAGQDVEVVGPFSDLMGHAGALVRRPDGIIEAGCGSAQRWRRAPASDVTSGPDSVPFKPEHFANGRTRTDDAAFYAADRAWSSISTRPARAALTSLLYREILPGPAAGSST